MNILYTAVGSLPNRSAIFIEDHKSIGYCIDTMMLHNIRHIMVVGKNTSHLTGVVSVMDIMRAMFESAGDVDFMLHPVSDIMSKNPFFLSGEETVRDAILLINNLGVSGLPIMSDENITGYFGLRDIISPNMDFVWINIEDQTIGLEDDHVGRLITEREMITDDFSIWQASDKFIHSDRRNLIVTNGLNQKYMGLITPSHLLSTLIPSFGIKFKKNILQDTPINGFKLNLNTFTTTSSSLLHIRKEMSIHHLDALPIVRKQKIVKIINEKDLTGYLALHL